MWHAHLARDHGRDARATRRIASRTLLLIQLPARIQVVEIQNCVEDQRITSRSLPAPERIHRKENHVTTVERRINYCSVLRNLVTAVEQTRNQKFVGIPPTQNYARPLIRRNQSNQIAALFF